LTRKLLLTTLAISVNSSASTVAREFLSNILEGINDNRGSLLGQQVRGRKLSATC
jgi:hypothetical protein